MIIHRAAEVRDLDAILDVIAHARRAIGALGIDQWQDGYPEPAVIRADIAAGIGHVFEENGHIGAYLALAPSPEPVYAHIDGVWQHSGPYLTVHRMCVDDGLRRRGLGARMLAFAQERARNQGCVSVRADTHRGNIAMQGLLKKCGFVCCGEVRYEVQAGDPVRIAYEKSIEDS